MESCLFGSIVGHWPIFVELWKNKLEIILIYIAKNIATTATIAIPILPTGLPVFLAGMTEVEEAVGEALIPVADTGDREAVKVTHGAGGRAFGFKLTAEQEATKVF
jgi:hypothetical protein